MRDPERLDKFYDTLKEVHKKYFPDWRFIQFISNILIWWSKKSGEQDFFFHEEEEVINIINEFIETVLQGE